MCVYVCVCVCVLCVCVCVTVCNTILYMTKHDPQRKRSLNVSPHPAPASLNDRNIACMEHLTNRWSGADYQIAFSRGNKTFIALNLEGYDINTRLQTGLPKGTYCDVISGNLENGRCTGKSV